MAKTKIKKFKVIPNPELQEAARGFVPVFGSEDDLHIVNRMLAIHEELQTVDNVLLRGKDPSKITDKMKDILFRERGLIHAIISRNMDF